MGQLFKPKIALQNLHDGPTRYTGVFGHHVSFCEREFVEKGAQALCNVDHWATWSGTTGA
jgi:hypothetical protein